MATGTVELFRVLRAPPERIYQAFITADALAKWLPPQGFTAHVHALDARVGGRFRMSFTQFSTGHGHGFGGEYLQMEPGRLLRYTDQFDDPGLPGLLTVTVKLTPGIGGTRVDIRQEGIPEQIPVDMCHMGWQESLEQLRQLVEPQSP